jgi:hypothetical protein
MANCVNKSNPQVKELADKLNISVELAAAKIGVWQENNNNYDNFPSVEDLRESKDTLQIKPGVAELFESNPELVNIGTQEQYSQYLDTIFPDSKVKDIVYHRTNNVFDKFDKSKFKEATYQAEFGEGFYFSSGKENTIFGKNLISVIVNLKNPLSFNSAKDFGDKITSNYIQDLSKNKDGIISGYEFLDLEEKGISESSVKVGENEYLINGIYIVPADQYNQYVVFEPEQIHILGNKQDIEGFKKFVENKSEEQTEDDLSTEQLTSLRYTEQALNPSDRLVSTQSISYLLLVDEAKSKLESNLGLESEGVSNTDRVKNIFEARKKKYEVAVSEAQSILDSTEDPAIVSKVSGILSKSKESLRLYSLITNPDMFKKLMREANTNLKLQGFKNTTGDYFEQLEADVAETERVQFDAEYAAKEDRRLSISDRLKQLIAFIPKIEVDPVSGKSKQKVNKLGLPQFNDYNSTFVQAGLVLSTYRFIPTKSGLDEMVKILKDVERNGNNPMLVKLAEKLEESPETIQREFFVKFNQQYSDYRILLLKYKKEGKSRNLDATISRADKQSSVGLITRQLEGEFVSQGLASGLLTIKQSQDKTEFGVNTSYVQERIDKLLDLADKSKYPGNFINVGKKGPKFIYTDSGIKEIHKALNELGLNFTEHAVKSFVNNYKRPQGSYSAASNIKDLALLPQRLLNPTSNVNTETSEESTSFDNINPFKTENRVIKALSGYEFSQRSHVFSASMRVGENLLFGLTRHTPATREFLRLTNPNNPNAENKYVVEKLDPTSSKKDINWTYSNILHKFQGGTNPLSDKDFVSKFKLVYPRGYKVTSTKGSEVKEASEYGDAEFEQEKLNLFQNNGNKSNIVLYKSDTNADKKTIVALHSRKFLTVEKDDFSGNVYAKESKLYLSDKLLNKFVNYFRAEYDRILAVQEQNEDKTGTKIKNYHKENGNGLLFFRFIDFNKEILPTIVIDGQNIGQILYDNIYDKESGKLKPWSEKSKDEVEKAARTIIKSHFNKIFKEQRQSWVDIGLLKNNNAASITEFMDKKYLSNIRSLLGNNPSYEQLLTYAIVDYTLNFNMYSNEMLNILGDPSLHGKSRNLDKTKDAVGIVNHLKKVYDDVSKRNANLMASSESGMFDTANYNNVTISDIEGAQFIKDNVKSYVDSLGKKVADAFGDSNLADAFEMTTVEEHLHVMKAFSKIDSKQYKRLLGIFDPQAYRVKYNEQPPVATKEDWSKELPKLLKFSLGAHKPVQVGTSTEAGLGISIKFYGKTSSIPLIPAMLNKNMKALLADMKNSKNPINRVVFESGVKLGIQDKVDAFDLNTGEYQAGSILDKGITRSREDFGIQLELPYKPDKQEIRESTQLMKLIFANQSEDLVIASENKTIGKLQEEYVSLHDKIVKHKLNKLLESIGGEFKNNKYSINDVDKLSKYLTQAAEDKGFSALTIQGLRTITDKQGRRTFNIPLGFLTNSGQIESMITSLFSEELVRLQRPGRSYVQASEILTLGAGKYADGVDTKETSPEMNNQIIWTKPEHAKIDKLKYAEEGSNGTTKAQIIIGQYITDKDGKLVDLTSYVNPDTNILDTTKIDPELLTITGFRIPNSGHNSMMVFEVVGFLPRAFGDIAVVPAEIAAQMGSDYDVDKLYTYHYKTWSDESGKLVKGTSKITDNPLDDLNNRSIEIEQNILMSPHLFENLMTPLGFATLDKAADEIQDKLSKEDSEWLGGQSTVYQRRVYFDNATGKFGTAIASNALTEHADAQKANLFIKDGGVRIKRSNGQLYSDLNSKGNRVNPKTEDLYGYENESGKQNSLNTNDSAWRLDKIKGFSGKLISLVLSEIQNASLDNAKNKTLGRAGINTHNFNVAILLAKTGFDEFIITRFVNQPILLEWYKQLDILANDAQKTEFEAGAKTKAYEALKKKYVDQFKLGKDTNFDVIPNEQELLDNVGQDINEDNVMLQLSILEQYLEYDDLVKELNKVHRRTNTSSKGLPKNIYETMNKADEVIAHRNSDVIGNSDKIDNSTVSGVFVDIPQTVKDIFSKDPNNIPLFSYYTPAYVAVREKISNILNRDLYPDDVNKIHNAIHEYLYSNANLQLGITSAQSERSRLLNSEPIVDSFRTLKARYPDNFILNSINILVDYNPSNPSRLQLQNISKEDEAYVERMQEEWRIMFNSVDPQLAKFAQDLASYALFVNPTQFGPSNIIKYLPYKYLEVIGFPETLRNINLEDESTLIGFVEQFLQHNPQYAPYANIARTRTNAESGTQPNQDTLKKNIGLNIKYKTATNDKGELFETETVDSFELPKLDTENTALNRYIRMVGIGNEAVPVYVDYISLNSPDLGRVLYVRQDNPDNSEQPLYKRADKLGALDTSEYGFGEQVNTLFPDQRGIINNKTSKAPQVSMPKSITAEEAYLKDTHTPSSLLNTVIARTEGNNNYTLFNKLAKNLERLDTRGYQIKIDNSTRGPGRHAGGTVKTISLNPSQMKDFTEGRMIQTILHEFAHKETSDKLRDPEFLKTKEGKAFLNVYNAYKNSIVDKALADSKKERLIPQELIKAEVFSILYNKESENDLDITNLETLQDANTNSPEFINLMTKLSAALESNSKFEASDKLQAGTERYNDVAKFIKETFKPENLTELKAQFYPYASVLEFATEVMTNEATQRYLKSMPSINQKGTNTSLWQDFIDAVSKLLAYLTNSRTLLNDAIEATIDVIEYKEGGANSTLDISNSEVKKEPHWRKDQAMAQASTKAIAKPTTPKTTNYKSSTAAYLKAIGGSSSSFNSNDKVWVFGAGGWSSTIDNISKDFNEYYKPTIDKAISQGVTTFNVGTASGIDALVTDYLKSKGFKVETKEGWNQISTQTNPQSPITDQFKYYGKFYDITLDGGKAVDVAGYKSKRSDMQKILDAYNTNPNVDPQNNKPFRESVNKVEQNSSNTYKLPGGKVITFNSQQVAALDAIEKFSKSNKNTFTLSGFAGTGKTTIIKKFLDGYKGRVAVSAPTHKAKNVISKTTGKTSHTIQSLLGLLPNTDLDNFNINNPQFDAIGNAKISEYRLLILDEASMLNKDLYKLLTDMAKDSGTKIIFMGDPAQIPPVGESLSLVFEKADEKSELTKVERTKEGNPLLPIFDSIRDNLESPTDKFEHMSAMNTSGEGVHFTNNEESFKQTMINAAKKGVELGDPNYTRVLAWTNNMVSRWNSIIREGIYGKDVAKYVPGDILMSYNTIGKGNNVIIENSSDYMVKSVSEDLIEGIEVYSLVLEDTETGETKFVNIIKNNAENISKFKSKASELLNTAKKTKKWRPYYAFKESFITDSVITNPDGSMFMKKDIDYGYALTVHKSQGSTYTHVGIVENNIDANKDSVERNKIKYVAFSRASKQATVLSNKSVNSTEDDLGSYFPKVSPEAEKQWDIIVKRKKADSYVDSLDMLYFTKAEAIAAKNTFNMLTTSDPIAEGKYFKVIFTNPRISNRSQEVYQDMAEVMEEVDLNNKNRNLTFVSMEDDLVYNWGDTESDLSNIC